MISVGLFSFGGGAGVGLFVCLGFFCIKSRATSK